MVDTGSDEQLGFENANLRANEGGVSPGVLNEEARVAAGLVGQRSAFRGRALAIIMTALSALQAGCTPSNQEVGRDKDDGQEVQKAITQGPNVMFMDDGVKLFGYAKEPIRFIAKLEDKDGKILKEESHELDEGKPYNFAIKFPVTEDGIIEASTLVVVIDGHEGDPLVYENNVSTSIQKMPRK